MNLTVSRIARIAAASAVAAALTSLGAVAQQNAPANPPPAPPYVHTGPWSADTSLSSKLAATAAAGDFAINPPAGYTSITRDSPDGFGTVYRWNDVKRSDGTQPFLDVIVAHAPPADVGKVSATEVLENFLGNLRVHKLTWSVSDDQNGKVDGITFVRAYYTGVEDVKGDPGGDTHGFVYVAEPKSGTFLILNGEDAMPYADTTLPVIEDSALTVREKGAPPPAGAPK